VVLKCTKCNQIKPSSEFHKRKDKKNGFTSNCKSCRNVHSKGKARSWRLKNVYNVTQEEVIKTLICQKYLCALCGKSMDNPHIDHDHATGKFRALIHKKCNLLLGHADDNIELLAKAIIYLSKFV
jgi:hypothetical protein